MNNFKVGDKEFYELLDMFERTFPSFRKDREEPEMWARGNVYQHGEYNKLFLIYRAGYTFGKTVS